MLFAYFRYWLRKEDQYSLQSSQIYNVYLGLIRYLNESPTGDLQIEKFRAELLANKESIRVEDLGAGSKRVPGQYRQVHKIAKYSTSGPKFNSLYQYFCKLTPAENVIELGTCLGICTRYLSLATGGKLYTFEGSSEILRIAKEKFPSENTEFLFGQIQNTLPELLTRIPRVDFALIDANHTYEGTIFAWKNLKSKITQSSIIAIADIHWSAAMQHAWEEIKRSPEVTLSMDFFECGILIFDYSGPKTHLVLAI